LDALAVGITEKKVNWVLDMDIRDFFGTIDHEWLVRFVEHRIADRRIVRLIQKWLRAGVLEDGERKDTEAGTPQGGVVSPLLANIYLHYVFDLWARHWRRQATGDVVIVRYADDIVVGFQREAEARRFWTDLVERFAKFGLELHPEKTRLLSFGRRAAARGRRNGRGKPPTFDFLGFTHICGKSRKERFQLLRLTSRKRVQRKLSEVTVELRRRLHRPVPEVGRWLRSVIQGHINYFGVPLNYAALSSFRFQIIWRWRRALSRRSQKGRVTWARVLRLAELWLPPVRITHPYPSERLCLTT
jgi:group II intron reverse transcriptase/maturase